MHLSFLTCRDLVQSQVKCERCFATHDLLEIQGSLVQRRGSASTARDGRNRCRGSPAVLRVPGLWGEKTLPCGPSGQGALHLSTYVLGPNTDVLTWQKMSLISVTRVWPKVA